MDKLNWSFGDYILTETVNLHIIGGKSLCLFLFLILKCHSINQFIIFDAAFKANIVFKKKNEFFHFGCHCFFHIKILIQKQISMKEGNNLITADFAIFSKRPESQSVYMDVVTKNFQTIEIFLKKFNQVYTKIDTITGVVSKIEEKLTQIQKNESDIHHEFRTTSHFLTKRIKNELTQRMRLNRHPTIQSSNVCSNSEDIKTNKIQQKPEQQKNGQRKVKFQQHDEQKDSDKAIQYIMKMQEDRISELKMEIFQRDKQMMRQIEQLRNQVDYIRLWKQIGGLKDQIISNIKKVFEIQYLERENNQNIIRTVKDLKLSQENIIKDVNSQVEQKLSCYINIVQDYTKENQQKINVLTDKVSKLSQQMRENEDKLQNLSKLQWVVQKINHQFNYNQEGLKDNNSLLRATAINSPKSPLNSFYKLEKKVDNPDSLLKKQFLQGQSKVERGERKINLLRKSQNENHKPLKNRTVSQLNLQIKHTQKSQVLYQKIKNKNNFKFVTQKEWKSKAVKALNQNTIK